MTSPEPTPSALKTASCPHLGIREDPQTCLAYPAGWNLCYRARPVRAVSLEQQRELCLSPVFTCCPVYARERRSPLPKGFRLARTVHWLRWALLGLLLLALALGLWTAWRSGVRWPASLDQLVLIAPAAGDVLARHPFARER